MGSVIEIPGRAGNRINGKAARGRGSGVRLPGVPARPIRNQHGRNTPLRAA
jgi:hypothetical protein